MRRTSLVWGAIVGAVLLSAALPFAWKTPDNAFHWALLAVIGVVASGLFIANRQRLTVRRG